MLLAKDSNKTLTTIGFGEHSRRREREIISMSLESFMNKIDVSKKLSLDIIVMFIVCDINVVCQLKLSHNLSSFKLSDSKGEED